MDSGSLIIYIAITSAYFILISLPIPESIKKIAKYVYFLLVIASQIIAAFTISKKMCGTAQISDIFIWGFIPWIIVFLGLNLVLTMFPGWKAPFSNTFGYLFAKLFGIRNVFNEMLKPSIKSSDAGLNKLMEEVYEDSSILINQITPENFDVAITKLGKLWDRSASNFTGNMEKLKLLVTLKDNVSMYIWSILIGTITASMASTGLMSSECVKSTQQVHNETEAYLSHLEKESNNKKEKRIYTVKD
jgi:hypothetical protein